MQIIAPTKLGGQTEKVEIKLQNGKEEQLLQAFSLAFLSISIMFDLLAYYATRRRRDKYRSRGSQIFNSYIASDENYSSFFEANEKNFDKELKAEEKEKLRR